jgi:predicted metalloendopeptidase
VPPYISSYGISEEVEELIASKIDGILKNCIKKSKEPVRDNESDIEQYQRGIGLVAQSALHPGEQKHSVDTVKQILKSFDCLRGPEDVARTMGELAKYKIKGLLWVYGEYQNNKGTEYHLNIGVGTVGLPDASYYLGTGPGKTRTLLHYAKLLDDVGKRFDLSRLRDCVAIEKQISEAIQNSLGDEKHETTGAGLARSFPDIPWAPLFEALGLEDWKTQTIFVDSKTWLYYLQELFRAMTLESWKLIFSLEVILHSLEYLPPPYDDLHFRFFRRELRGQTSKIPQNRLTIDAVGDWMTPFLSRLYVIHYVPEHLKEIASVFAKEIKNAAYERMDAVDWLSPKSREAAKKKIKKMITTVAYPDSFRSLKLPSLQSHNFIQNLLSLGAWRTGIEFHRLGELRSKQKDWDESVFAVNAYYFSTGNEIVIPSGSLEWPFYDESDRLLGFNYGGLGAILGHEMTHGFDEDGKEYDPDGFRKRWWGQADIRAYAKKAEDLITLFGKQKIFGYHVNGSLTLSENIADLGGLAISLDALRVRLEKERRSEQEKKEAYKQCFIAFAISWRIKEKRAKILQGLFVDRHAPAFLRVNLIVSQFQEWYDAFDIKESEPMYIEPEKRIRIF